MSTLLKKITTLALATMITLPAFAAEENVEVSPEAGTTREEIAAMHVLSEICPQIIGNNKNFNDRYVRVLKDLLPGISDPVAAVKAYSQDPEFQPAIAQAREDAARATAENNRQVCLDVIDW